MNYLPFNHFTAGVLVSQPAERTNIQTAEEPKHKTRGKNESRQDHRFLSLRKNNLKCPGQQCCPLVMSLRVCSEMLREWAAMVIKVLLLWMLPPNVSSSLIKSQMLWKTLIGQCTQTTIFLSSPLNFPGGTSFPLSTFYQFQKEAEIKHFFVGGCIQGTKCAFWSFLITQGCFTGV